MTEQEAHTKWCPQTRFHSAARETVWDNKLGGDQAHQLSSCCIASDCMMWRWHQEPPVSLYEDAKTPYSKIIGYCGLGGKP